MGFSPTLLQEYIHSLVIPAANTPRLFFIGMIGLPGSGKSTVAQVISGKTGLLLTSNDHIRSWLEKKGMSREEINPTTHEISKCLATELLARGISFICDADILTFVEVTQTLANQFRANLYLLKITCPENIVMERLSARINNPAEISKADLQTYAHRREIHQRHPDIPVDFNFQTDAPLAAQVDKFISKLHNDEVLLP